jgi:hypothetical protein
LREERLCKLAKKLQPIIFSALVRMQITKGPPMA